MPVLWESIVCVLTNAMKALATLPKWIDVHGHTAKMG